MIFFKGAATLVFHMLDLHPATLLVTIVVVLVTTHLVKAIGKQTLQDKAWDVYVYAAPRLGHAKFAHLAEKRRALVDTKREMKSISAQDEYARWTKLNRLAEKLGAEITTLTEELLVEKTLVSRFAGLVVTALTTLPIWVARLWFRKSRLFYLPNGVLPYYVEWVLAIPFFPVGAVGLTIWMMAVNSVLNSLTFVIRYALEEAPEKPKPEKASSEAK